MIRIIVITALLLTSTSFNSYSQTNNCFNKALKKLHFTQKPDTAAWTSIYQIGNGWSCKKFIKMVKHYVPEEQFNCIVQGYRNTALYKIEFVLVLKNKDSGKTKIQSFNFDVWRSLIYQ